MKSHSSIAEEKARPRRNTDLGLFDDKGIKVEKHLFMESDSTDVPMTTSSENIHCEIFSSNVEAIKVEPMILWEVPGLCQLPVENSDSFLQACYKQTFYRKTGISEVGKISHCDNAISHCSSQGNLNTQLNIFKEQLKIHDCSFCDKNFKRKSDLNRHILSVHEKKKAYKCSSCTKGFCSKCHLSRHLRTVHKACLSDSNFSSNDSVIRSEDDLSRIIQKNHEQYILENYEALLNCNIKKAIPKKLRKHKCLLCEKAFTRKSDLFRHTQTVHEKTKAFKCALCEKDFGWKSDLYRHIQTVHEKIKAYECFFCDKNFSKNSHLTRHIQTVHEKLKPYKCSVCEKDFGRKGDLSLHFQVVHEKKKAHKCNLCEKGFSQKSHLANHILVAHENVQANKCSICDKKFSKNSNLYRHILLIHKKKALNL